MNFCKYKNLLGRVNRGVHSYRIYNIAVVDVLLTLVASYFLSKQTSLTFIQSSIIMFILGIVLHRLFCVRTTVDKLLFS